MMNPELETKIEAYLFAEMSADDRAHFETEMAQSADLRAVVAERQELALLVRRAFLREKVRAAQSESSEIAADVPKVVGRTVSMQPLRFAVAAGFAAVLAAAAWFFWQQTEKLQQEIAQIDTSKPLSPISKEPTAVEKPAPIAETPVAEKLVENPKTDDGIKILTDKPGKTPSKIAEAPATGSDRTLRPQTYGTETRGLNQNGARNEKGEAIYRAAHQKPDLSRFKGTAFDNFIGIFDKNKFADANRLLSQMEVTTAQEDARELLLGIANLELGDTNTAVQHLMNIYEPKNAYYFDAQWWLALAFCREGKLEAARDVFQTISKSGGHPFRSRAELALRNF